MAKDRRRRARRRREAAGSSLWCGCRPQARCKRFCKPRIHRLPLELMHARPAKHGSLGPSSSHLWLWAASLYASSCEPGIIETFSASSSDKPVGRDAHKWRRLRECDLGVGSATDQSEAPVLSIADSSHRSSSQQECLLTGVGAQHR